MVLLHADPATLAFGELSYVPNREPNIVRLAPIEGDVMGSTLTGRGGPYTTDRSRMFCAPPSCVTLRSISACTCVHGVL